MFIKARLISDSFATGIDISNMLVGMVWIGSEI